jgi:hypothetical protein
MPLLHAVAFVDHQNAQVLLFDAEHVKTQKIKTHTHHTRQHGSVVRTEHEFFGHVCDSLTGAGEVLVVGRHTGQADFKHYLEKHRPEVAKRVVGFEIVDHPTENQLLALARKYFLERERTAGTSGAS